MGIGLYRLYYRTGNSTFQTQARQFADIQWQWMLDHGYNYPFPRAASMVSSFFRALDGHSERFPGLYAEVTTLVRLWADPSFSPNIDNRESGYTLWDVALGAKTDTDPTRHAQYCSWLNTYVTSWNSVQSADGSWGENEYSLNPSYVSAPKSFTAPFLYEGAPWREAINLKAMEAAYESLNDTTSQGCNNASLAASDPGHHQEGRGVGHQLWQRLGQPRPLLRSEQPIHRPANGLQSGRNRGDQCRIEDRWPEPAPNGRRLDIATEPISSASRHR